MRTMAKKLNIFGLVSFLLATTSNVLGAFHPPVPAARVKKDEIRLRPRNWLSCANKGEEAPLYTLKHRYTASQLYAYNSNVPLDIGDSTTRLSYYDPTEETAALKQALQDTTEKLSSYSEVLKSNAANANDIIGDVQTKLLKSSGEKLVVPPEVMLQARDDFADAVTRQFSSETLQSSSGSLLEFSRHYTSSLDSAYKLSELFDAIRSGTMITDSMKSVTFALQGLIEAMQIKQNAAFVLLIASVFWGSNQRRAGVEQGMKMSGEVIAKMEAELQASKNAAIEMESEIQATKKAAKVENKANAAEVDDLRQQMQELRSQVETLSAVAKEVTQQLKEAKASSGSDVSAVSTETDGAAEAKQPSKRKKKSGVKKVKKTPSTAPAQDERIEVSVPPSSIEVTEKSGVKKVKKTLSTETAQDERIEVSVPPSSIEVTEDAEELGESDLVETDDARPIAIKTQSRVKGLKTPVTTATPTKKKAKKKKTLKKTKAGTKKRKVVAANSESGKTKTVKITTKTDGGEKEIILTNADWANLSASTLKRKTVKELTGYLTEKGVECTDANGKTLKKDSLVGLVLSN